MKTVGSYEAKTHLPQLLDKVAKGETITITKHGVPVAMLVPPAEGQRADPSAIIDTLREFRRGIKLRKLPIREMIEEGRR